MKPEIILEIIRSTARYAAKETIREHARAAGKARMKKLSKRQRSDLARKGGLASAKQRTANNKQRTLNN